MGMGAMKPGSTVPPQGGKGGVQPTQPQSPYTPIGAQGGKGGVQQPGRNPLYGTDADPRAPRVYPQQPQVPAQGGKAPLTPQQQADLAPYIDPIRPMPQVSPPQGGFPQRDLGYGNPPPRPTVPAQGGKGNMPLPADYQSRYGNYGFDSGLQNYLDQQYVGSTRDAGVGYQYDPTTQTFTGGTMSGQYNPIPLSVMQQAAGGNREVLSPYFQSRFPQTATTQPQGGFPQRDLGYGNQLPQGMPRPVSQVMPRPVPQVLPRQPAPKPAPQPVRQLPNNVRPSGPQPSNLGLAGLRGRR